MSTSACVGTSLCRVASRQRNEPEFVRLHFVLDHERLYAELRGSWLASSIKDRVLDCSGGTGAGGGGVTTSPPVWTARPFDPLGNASSDGSEVEIFHFMLDPDSFQSAHIHQPIKVVPCDAKHNMDNEGLQALGVNYQWRPFARSGGRSRPPPTSVRHAIHAASSHAALVFTMSWIPDVGKEYVESVRNWLVAQRLAPLRALVLHYRVGRLPNSWAGRFTRAELRDHVFGERGKEGLPREAFWNSYWRLLVDEVRLDRGRELCRQQQHLSGDRHRGPCDDTTLLSRWCAATRTAPSPHVQPKPSKMLVLGGDAHYNREVILKRLEKSGLLRHALWSLSTPVQCNRSVATMHPSFAVPRPLSDAEVRLVGLCSPRHPRPPPCHLTSLPPPCQLPATSQPSPNHLPATSQPSAPHTASERSPWTCPPRLPYMGRCRPLSHMWADDGGVASPPTAFRWPTGRASAPTFPPASRSSWTSSCVGHSTARPRM